MLACKHLAKSHGNRKVLTDVSLRVEPGECVCVTGEGGSGKTTLMKLLVGMDVPTAGTVEVDGVVLSRLPLPVLQLYRSRLGVIFQEPLLLSHATAEENVAVPLELKRMNPMALKRRTNDLLKQFNLLAKADCLPSELSVSERACAGIARAFAANPLILIADEPFALLDSAQSAVLFSLLEDARHRGASIILFSRDGTVARKLGARVLKLKDGKMALETGEMTAPASTHRILEAAAPQAEPAPAAEPEAQAAPAPQEQEEEHAVTVTAKHAPKHRKKAAEQQDAAEPAEHPAPAKGGKKIRITAIGS